MTRCDLHVHSRYSTDSGSFALRRARLGESYTDPERIWRTCKARGMDLVTITDHNTVEGALRIAHLPDTFLSVEVTSRFPEDDVPLHVLVWGLTEEDHRDLQPYRPSVYELQSFLAHRGLAHALAHPLYRMGPPITTSHVERLMLLFPLWEGRNGGRPRGHNELAERLAGAATAEYLAKLAERHGLEPRHPGRIGLCGGSDDHGALDIATTWTEAPGADVERYLEDVMNGAGVVGGAHGSIEKLAHAVLALLLNAYRETQPEVPVILQELARLFDDEASHAEISAAIDLVARRLGQLGRAGGLDLGGLGGLGVRAGHLLFAGLLQTPFLATAHHHAGAARDIQRLEEAFFGRPARAKQSVLVFTDTFGETNGVAGTMRRLAHRSIQGVSVVAAGVSPDAPGVLPLDTDWTAPVPAAEQLLLRFPSLLEVLALVDRERPDVIHLSTPGPVGACALLVARVMGLPVVAAYHTELGAYALHATRDLLVAETLGSYVDWFYRQADVVLAPTTAVAAALAERGVGRDVRLWGRGVDTEMFTPIRRRETVRRALAPDADVVLLSVGRLAPEKRVDVLLDAFATARRHVERATLLVVGDGPSADGLRASAPDGVRFLGELHGDYLADVYANADVFCFASTTETFGQVVLEAGASALPVIAVDAGGSAELVTDGVSGLLVSPDDADAMAEAMIRLAGDPALRLRLGAEGRARATERTWDRSFGQLRDVWRDAADNRGQDRSGELRRLKIA